MTVKRSERIAKVAISRGYHEHYRDIKARKLIRPRAEAKPGGGVWRQRPNV